MKKDCKVKAHRRNGKMIKSHSRTIKGSMKNTGSGMSAEECKAKYDAMVAKYGADSPQAKKLAMKMEGMETVEKNSRKNPKLSAKAVAKLYKNNPSLETPDHPKKVVRNIGESSLMKIKTKEGKFKVLSNPRTGDTWHKDKKVKKHSRGDYMRKNVEEDLLTKEAKAKKGKSAYSDKQVTNMKSTADNKKATHDRMAKLRAMKKK